MGSQQILLYSTNPYLKLHIQERFRADKHFVWCSEIYDSSTAGTYSAASLTPPTSTPGEIFRSLRAEVQAGDKHSYKINEQKAALIKRAREWLKNKEIDDTAHKEILYIAKNAAFKEWRPLVYVIPRPALGARLAIVPPQKRANPLAVEYIIANLDRTEFDVIEW